MDQNRTFPLNAWYAAAWCHEVGKRKPLARTICNDKIVLWRTTDGSVSALEDACWHRQLPLSLGHIDGDEVVCLYHGLGFNCEGKCSRMPSQDELNPNAKVRSYPVIEKYRLVWIWPGDPALANTDLVPDFHWNDDPEWAGDGETLRANCNYQLFVDNLMDLTHESFVHATSIGNAHVADTPMTTTQRDNKVISSRWMTDIDAPPFWRAQLDKPGNVDRWQIIEFEPPCTIILDVGVAPTGTGAPDGDRSKGVNGRVLNTITPETDNTCMYFWSLVRNYKLSDQSLTTLLREANGNIFLEDLVVVEAQQIMLDENKDRQLHNLNIDAGSMRARRLVDDMIAKETENAAG